MFGLGTNELIIVLVIVLVLFGGRKIPELLRGVGKGVGELQKGLDEGRKSFERGLHEDAAATATTTDESSQPKPVS